MSHYFCCEPAVVTLGGQDHYLGPWRSKVSRIEYDRLTSEWLANGRRLASPDSSEAITITELIAAYWRFAGGYYIKNGQPTKELEAIRDSFRPLKRLYGRERARNFGPLKLKTVRQLMIDAKLCRKTVNDRISRVKRMFKWATENELVAPVVFHGLQAVSGLRRGRSEARETDPVGPVPDDRVDAVLAQVPPVVAAMIQLQRLTGMRSGELTIMHGCDLDMSGKVWLYSPTTHKTEHHGHERPIYLGPQAQEIIRYYLKADLSAHLFSPSESEHQRSTKRRADRKSPMTPSQAKRRPKRRRRRPPGAHYTTDTYRRAIERGCEKAFPPSGGLTDEEIKQWRKDHRWHPHQLRHNAATRLRKEFGIEAARVVLGHRSAAVTEIYAEIDGAKAAEIMARVG